MNLKIVGINQSGRKMSQKTKDKISKSLKGNPQNANKSHCVGKNHHNYIDTIYDFVNIFTLENFSGTRKDFMNHIGIHWRETSYVTRLIQGRSNTSRGWTLKERLPQITEKLYKGASKHRPYIFTKEKEVFIGTLKQFKEHFNIDKLNHVQAVVRGKRKTTKGWNIRPLGR